MLLCGDMKTGIFKYGTLFLFLGAMLLHSCLPDSDYKISVNYEPAENGDGWEIAPAASHGFNVGKLQDIYEMMFDENSFVTSKSLLIVRNGKLVSESYFRDKSDIDKKTNIKGVTKSITSLLTGMAWDRDLIQLDHRLYGYIPGYFDGDMNKRDITAENMLTMTIGLDWDHEQHSIDLFNSNRFPSTMRIVLTKAFVDPAGSSFFYNQGPPQLAMGVLREVFKQEDTDSIIHSLFDPLGIDDFIWEQHQDGLHIGGLGLHLKPRDLARIGQFCLQKGWWNGEQIVSAGWIDLSTSVHIEPEMTGSYPGYGYYWWTHKENGAYFAMGDGGQYLYIVPGKNLVIVHTANPSAGSGYDGIGQEDFLTLASRILDAIE